jgi:DNA-binding MarR family transcriptional regulator
MSTVLDLPGHLIRRLHQKSVAHFAANMTAAGFDLTPVQYATLATLEDNPGIDQATLSALIACDRVTMGGVVSRLEERGYVERAVRKDDRRARVLHITERGASLLRVVMPAVRETQEQTLHGLSEEERVQFMGLLARLVDAGDGGGAGR